MFAHPRLSSPRCRSSKLWPVGGWPLVLTAVLMIGPTDSSAGDTTAGSQAASEHNADADDQAKSRPDWKPLEIGSGGSWVESRFGGDGEIKIGDGVISLGFGDPLTGVRWEGEFPKLNYEISLEARRTAGFDFFCGMTVPVGDQRCSLILGGWGGSLIGLSSIGGEDAANNETMMIREFEQNRWYKIRMRVAEKRIQVWLDDEEIIDFERDDRPLDIRAEMEQSTPVGVAAFQCESQIRNVRVRRLP